MEKKGPGGFLLYRCRLCGEVFEGVHAPEAGLVALSIIEGWPLKDYGGSSSMVSKSGTDFHFHNADESGIGDLCGYRLD